MSYYREPLLILDYWLNGQHHIVRNVFTISKDPFADIISYQVLRGDRAVFEKLPPGTMYCVSAKFPTK